MYVSRAGPMYPPFACSVLGARHTTQSAGAQRRQLAKLRPAAHAWRVSEVCGMLQPLHCHPGPSQTLVSQSLQQRRCGKTSRRSVLVLL